MKSSTSILLVLSTLSAFLLYNGVQGLSRSHEFPYIVSFENVTLDHWCTGSIIADQFILTAAHCVMLDDVHFREFPHKIFAGIDDVNAEESTRVVAEVEKIYVSEKYNHSWWAEVKMAHDDWALLKLKTKLNVVNNPAMKIVDLPQRVNGKYKTYLSEVAVVPGYGQELIGDHKDTEMGLMHTNHVKVLDKSACAYYTKIGYEVYDSLMCVKYTDDKGKDWIRAPCSGDSGSPLVIDNTVIGIVSLSPPACDGAGAPSAYTRISSYVDTIKNAMNGKTEGLRVGVSP